MKNTRTTKRAFTLVELLAVIVILAVILVIAVPQIMNSIEKAKKGSMESSAKLVASELELKYNAALTTGDEFNTSGSCMSYGNLDTDEYESCTYTITNGKAKVTLKGKTGGKFDNYECTDASNVSATCEEQINYAITLNANGGVSNTTSLSIEPGSAYGELPTPTLSGSIFKGWYTASSGGVKVSNTDIPTEETTLYAQWITSVSFATDSWETIQAYVKAGSASTVYNVGDTKCIALNGFSTSNSNGCSNGEFKVRIANMSTPAECSTSGFSQSACGFVVEFVDIITKHSMNTEMTNVGGWQSSEMRTYIQENIQPAIISAVGNIIADTTIVSGHEEGKSSNYTTTDKVYLLSGHEVWTDVDENTSSGIVDYFDESYNNTRQLDYYNDPNGDGNNSDMITNTSNYSGAIKQFNGENTQWWLRSAPSTNYVSFIYVGTNGIMAYFRASDSYGISPAFRIA